MHAWLPSAPPACLVLALLMVAPAIRGQTSPSSPAPVSPQLPTAFVEALTRRARDYLHTQRPALPVERLRLEEIHVSYRPEAGLPSRPSFAESIFVRFVDPATRVSTPRPAGGTDYTLDMITVVLSRDNAAEHPSVQEGKLKGFTIP